ncbi:uncharacterized protein LOC129095904 [Anoplopoma fimbria]|uniref:uncharacterized protein LOC129095904 n=1 Tax=Anoplopoma fimbria TaxID=229290 RepID=UPI0023ED3784|nr:uncharacterized protein LOC129095904 [Anoplopoma fimbria]
MEKLYIFLVVLLGVASHGHDLISGSVLEKTVRSGENITLYCDCTLSSGVHIMWYRNCSHENQPSLVLRSGPLPKSEDFTDNRFQLKLPPRFHLGRNSSSESYDLLILNVTDSDEGFYYCGTEQPTVEDAEYIQHKIDYRYGNVTTRILFNSSPHLSVADPSPVFAEPWMVFTIAFTILSSVISFILVYHFCQETDKESQVLQERPDTRGQTRRDQDEDACFTRVVFRAKDGQTRQ